MLRYKILLPKTSSAAKGGDLVTEKVLVNKLLVSEKMLRGKYLVSEVILDNKILCPSKSSGTILMQTATATADFPILWSSRTHFYKI